MAMTDSAKTTVGWITFTAAIGMMLSLLSVDIITLKEWSSATTPAFVGTAIGHVAATIAAFIGGRLIPEPRNGQFTRATDQKVLP